MKNVKVAHLSRCATFRFNRQSIYIKVAVGAYLRPPKWPPPLLPPPFAEPPRAPLGRLAPPTWRAGRLPALTDGREVVCFGVKVELGLRCVPTADGRLVPPCPKLRRRTSLGRAVLRVLLSRLLRMLLRLPLKPVPGRLLSLLPLCGLMLPACGRLSPKVNRPAHNQAPASIGKNARMPAHPA